MSLNLKYLLPLWTLCFVVTMTAQSRVTVQDSAVPGIELIGSDAPTFANLLKSMIGGEPSPELQAELPYSIIVKNSSSRAVAAMGIRFEAINAQGRPVVSVAYLKLLDPRQSTQYLKPGSMRLACFERGYSDAVNFGGLKTLLLNPVYKVMARNLAKISQMQQIRASLDGIVFEDWQFQGPDLSGEFQRMSQTLQVERSLNQTLLLMKDRPDGDLALFLTQKGSAWKGSPPPIFQSDPAYTESKLANNMLNYLKSKGHDALFTRLDENLKACANIAVWK